MNIQIKATHMSLTPEIEAYLRKRLMKLDKLTAGDGDSVVARVELEKTANHHKSGDLYRAEINLALPGKNLFAAAEKEDVLSAIDALRDEVLREVRSHKGKRESLFLRGAGKIKKMLRFGGEE